MKTAFKLVSITAVAFLLTLTLPGCTKGEVVQLPENERQQAELTLSAKETKPTKAGEELLPDGTDVGVFVVEKSTNETLQTAVLSNQLYTTDATGNLNGSPAVLTMGYTYDVYAYVPYQVGLTGAATQTVSVAHGEDFLWANTTGEVPNTKTHSTELVFEHKVSQIQFEVQADPTSNPNIQGYHLSVSGFYFQGIMDLSTGVITPVIDHILVTMQPGSNSILFIPPVNGVELSLEVKIETTLSGGSAVYTGTLKKTFEPGTSYTYTVIVKDINSPLGFTGGLTDWVSGTGTGEVAD